MNVGVVLLPDLPWSDALQRWRQAEQIGFRTAWTYDHLSWRSLRDEPWLGSIPLLAAVAASTSTLRFGTLVTSPNFRHPALLAKDVMTLDQISGGRLDLGIGAGGTGYDATVLGDEPLSPADRALRFEEFVNVLDLLLREPQASYDGEFFTVDESRTFPGCVQQPRVPFTIAAAGPQALALAARHGEAWVTFGPAGAAEPGPADWYAAVRRQSGALTEACAAAGREPASMRRMALVGLELRWAQDSVGAWDDFTGRIGELGFTDVVLHWPRPHDQELPGPPEDVFAEICNRLGA